MVYFSDLTYRLEISVVHQILWFYGYLQKCTFFLRKGFGPLDSIKVPGSVEWRAASRLTSITRRIARFHVERLLFNFLLRHKGSTVVPCYQVVVYRTLGSENIPKEVHKLFFNVKIVNWIIWKKVLGLCFRTLYGIGFAEFSKLNRPKKF